VGDYFGACVYTARDQIGFWFGLANIFLWLFAQAPQIYANYKNKSVESISGLFLFTWLLGDVTNLVGCILTQQLPTQLYTAIYFQIMDVLMLSQYAYYTYKNRKPRQIERSDAPLVNYAENDSGNASALHHTSSGGLAQRSSDLSNGSKYRNFSIVMLFGFTSSILYLTSSWSSSTTSYRGRVLLQDDRLCNAAVELSDTAEIIGFVAAWLSGVLYFSARLPQIYVNYTRKATEGLSFAMFASSTTANIFYTLSIVIPKSTDWHSNHFLHSTLAYLLGSAGTIFSSIPILIQFHLYKDNMKSYTYLTEEDDILVEQN